MSNFSLCKNVFKRRLLQERQGDDVESAQEYLEEEKEFDGILVDSKTNKKIYYDAFLACDEDEEELVRFLAELLETTLNIRLFIEQRDMPIAVPRYSAIAYIIDKRCSKLLCCITNKFVQSAHCNFLVRFVQQLSPDGAQQKIMPLILDKKAEIPSVLTPLVKLNIASSPMIMDAFTQQASWERLAKVFNQTYSQSLVQNMPAPDSTSLSSMTCPATEDTVMSCHCSCNSSNPGSDDDTKLNRDEDEPKLDHDIHRTTNSQTVDKCHKLKQAVDQGRNLKTAKRRHKFGFIFWRK